MFEYKGNEQVQLFKGDCLEIMPLLSVLVGGDFDMVLTDPPYGTTACKWDSIIPLDAMWLNLKALVKPNAAMVMTASQPFTTTLIASNMKDFRYEVIWIKHQATNPVFANKGIMKIHENINVFYRKQPTYNPQFEEGNPYSKHTSRQGKKIGEAYGNILSHHKGNDGKTLKPVSFLYFNGFSGRKNKAVHPTQKPVALMEYLIKTYTNEGDTVLDFTMGSGTTGVACQNTGRKFVGIELDEDYFKIACDRMGVL